MITARAVSMAQGADVPGTRVGRGAGPAAAAVRRDPEVLLKEESARIAATGAAGKELAKAVRPVRPDRAVVDAIGAGAAVERVPGDRRPEVMAHRATRTRGRTTSIRADRKVADPRARAVTTVRVGLPRARPRTAARRARRARATPPNAAADVAGGTDTRGCRRSRPPREKTPPGTWLASGGRLWYSRGLSLA